MTKYKFQKKGKRSESTVLATITEKHSAAQKIKKELFKPKPAPIPFTKENTGRLIATGPLPFNSRPMLTR